MACHGAEALAAADLGVAETLLEEVVINPTMELPELTQDWEIDFWRAQTETWLAGSQEKGAVTPQETDLGLPGSLQES